MLTYYGKPSYEKSGLVMELFRKGSDPPLIFGSYGIREAHLIFDQKKVEKQNFQKHPKWPYLK